MSKDFVNAMLEWSKQKDAYIGDNISVGKLSPRKTIFITIPTDMEQEIKEYVKNKRAESDAIFLNSSERRKIELSIEFENKNPPPNAKDF